MVVDLTILHLDRKNHPVAKLIAWEQSAKLKAAETIKTFFDEKGQQPSLEIAPQIAFIKTDKVNVEKVRTRYCRTGNTPEPLDGATSRCRCEGGDQAPPQRRVR